MYLKWTVTRAANAHSCAWWTNTCRGPSVVGVLTNMDRIPESCTYHSALLYISWLCFSFWLLESLISHLNVWTFPKQHLKMHHSSTEEMQAAQKCSSTCSTDCNSWLGSSAVYFNFLRCCWIINSRRDRSRTTTLELLMQIPSVRCVFGGGENIWAGGQWYL